jgi:prepilin-type N-terminal cleavage/methylation domain-containing protein
MRPRGFSLLELSVVLTIISLLAGGVIAGKSVMRAAEIRTIMSSLQEYNKALASFVEKYGELPGDMSNATTIWGSHATCPGSYLTPSVNFETCNGDGNGQVTHNSTVASPNWLETYRAWQHMSASGLIFGKFTGVPSAVGNPNVSIGVNIPRGGVSGMGITMQQGSNAGGWPWFPSDYNLVFEYGAVASGAMTWTTGGALTGGEMFNFDSKIDDGRPSTGRVMELVGSARPSCVTTDVVATAQYIQSSTQRTCHIIFKTGY